MKIEIRPKQSPSDIEQALGFSVGSIRSIARYYGADPNYPAGTVVVDTIDLTPDQESQLRTYLGDVEEVNKRLSKSISGHIR